MARRTPTGPVTEPPPELSRDAAHKAVSALAPFTRHQVTTYLNTLWLQEPERWSILEKVAEAS